MKSFMMLAATLVVLAGSNAFAAREVGISNSQSISGNCDPNTLGCHNDQAAGPDCPLHKGGKLTDHQSVPRSEGSQAATANTEKTVR